MMNILNKYKHFIFKVALEINKSDDLCLEYIERYEHDDSEDFFVIAQYSKQDGTLIESIWEMRNGNVYEWGNSSTFEGHHKQLIKFQKEYEELNKNEY